jgi:hypothetical protein
MNRKGLISSGIILGTILAFILVLLGPIIVKTPEDIFAVMENEKALEQIKAERMAALEGLPAISVLGYETVLNTTSLTIKTELYNSGGDKAYSPSIEYIIIKDEKSYIPLGKPIDGYYDGNFLLVGGSKEFIINIVEPELIANLVNRTYVRVDIAFNYTSENNYPKKEIESILLKVG